MYTVSYFCFILTKMQIVDKFHQKIPNTKSHENLCSGYHAVPVKTSGWTHITRTAVTICSVNTPKICVQAG